tara:strand:+ start:5709 stop:6446 length:738 start_codon:yes stop_codon:yes gene_type:complete
MKWFDLFKKEPVDEAIDDLEEVADNYDLSEHEWSSVDDASDYLFEHKVKKRDIFDDLEDKKGKPVEFDMDKPRFSVEMKNIPEVWSRRYREEPGEDKPSRFDSVEDDTTITNLVLKGNVTIDTSGKGQTAPIDVYTTITSMTYDFNIDYEHNNFGEKYNPGQGYEQGGPKSYRMTDRDYSPLDIRLRVDTTEATKPDALKIKNSVNSGNYRINVNEVDEFIIDCHNSTEPKDWTHEIEIEWGLGN